MKKKEHPKTARGKLELKVTKPKQNFNFAQITKPLIKCSMGVTKLQICHTVQNLTGKNKKFMHFSTKYYKQEHLNFENFRKKLDQNTPEGTLQTNKSGNN